MAKTKIHGEYLDPSVISGQTQVTAVGADSMLVFDATDNALKKALLSDLIETVGATPTFSSVVVDTMTLDGSTLSATGDFILDSEGDIILDANGADFLFKDAGTLFFSATNSSGDTILANAVQDKDIFIRGNDGGSAITAVQFDMSDAGTAIFNHDIDLSGDIDASGQIFVGGQNSTFAENNLRFKSGGAAYIDHNTVGQDFIFRTSASSSLDTTALTIQHDGNLLVGGSNVAPVSNNVVGISLRAVNGEIQSSVNGAAALYLNRKTNDGDIAVFRKDGSTMGQIGTYGGTAYIGSVNGGIMFNGTDIEPTSGGAGRADNTIDLGSASYRFKDAFLGDGVYLGGTAAANKLDDYEEGTWTPRISSTTGTVMTGSNCTYTKVGRLVTIRFDITNGSGSNTDIIYGLPFTSAGHGAVHWTWNNLGNTEYIGGYTNTGSIQLIKSGSTTSWSFLNAYRAIGFGLYFTD